ncbi:MAG TPA: phage head closure protein [Agromyces sp.]
MARRSQVGRLHHRVELQEGVNTTTPSGQRTTAWTTRATVYASIRPLRGYEAFGAHQLQAEVSHSVRIRYDAGGTVPKAAWRVKYGTRLFRVESIFNVDEADRFLDLICAEEV